MMDNILDQGSRYRKATRTLTSPSTSCMNVQNYKKNLKSGKKILKLFNFACKNEEEALKAFKTKKNPFGMG